MLASEVIKSVKFEDPITHDLVCKAMESAYGLEYYDKEYNGVAARMFARAFCDANHEELSWYEIAVRIQKYESCHKVSKIKRYPLHLLMVLFDEGLYKHDDLDALRVLMPEFRKFNGKVYTDLFNPASRDLYGICFSYNLGCRYSYPILVNNYELRKLLFRFGNSAPIGVFNTDVVSVFFANFEASLPIEFTDYKCITTGVIQKQIAYYRDLNLFWGHAIRRPISMASLISVFYRWMYITYPDNHMMTDPTLLNPIILTRDVFTEMIIEGSLDMRQWYKKKRMHGMGTSYLNKTDHSTLPIRQMLSEYWKTLPTRSQRERFLLCKDLFVKSLREQALRIKSYKDFSEQTLFQQLEYIKVKYSKDHSAQKDAVEAIRRFYAYIIDTNPKHPFFKSSKKITKVLVKTRAFSDLFVEGYEFVRYSNIDYSKDISKLVVSFSDYDIKSGVIPKGKSYYKVDSNGIPNRLYRDFFLRFLFNNNDIEGRYIERRIILEILNLLFSLKMMPGNANPDLRHLSEFEADQIRTFILRKDLSDKSKSNLLNQVKLFFVWAEDSEEMHLAPLALIYFKSIPSHRKIPNNTSVPKEHIEIIAKHLMDNRQKHPKYELCFVVLNLLLQTPFRVKNICTLDRNCLIETGKDDVHIIRMKSKTSKGEYEDRTIPLSTYRLIKQTLSQTEPLLSKCSVEAWKDYLLLYAGPNGSILPLYHNNFHSTISDICKKYNLPIYTSSHLRNTYMTFTYMESSKREDREYFLKTNSYHKSKRTTIAHYVDRSKVLMNSSFGYSLGSEEELESIERAYRKTVDENLRCERITPDGIGFCDSKECIGLVSCLGCRHLVLTEDSAPIIQRIISDLDEKIVNCDIQHEKEGMIDIRAAYARCLNIINKYKEAEYERVNEQ